MSSSYRGRLAPSPTGYLHLGHARTFWIAQQRAQAAGRGTLVLRNEDLDGARCRQEFVAAMFEDLRWFGFEWQEGPDVGGPFAPYTQSERMIFYRQALDRLEANGCIYPCTCSRKDIESAIAAPHAGDDELIYPGTCRHNRQSQIANRKSGVQVSVYPALIPSSHVLADVNHVFNGVFVRGDVVGDTMFYGRGAGKDATASAVLSDVADAALDLKNGTKLRVPPFVAHTKHGRVVPMDEIVSQYYVRLNVVDRPGVLARIATVFAAAKIGISSVIQPEGHEGKSVPLIFMLHDAPNAAMRKALARIARLAVVKARPVMFRVEQLI